MATPPIIVNPGWDGGPQKPGDWNGWLGAHSAKFDQGVATLKHKLDEAYKKIAGGDGKEGDPTNPQFLADYQSALAEYTTFRSLQSNSAKSLADMQKQNARNLG